MPEESRYVAQAVGLVSMDGGVIVAECLLEAIIPNSVKLAEPLANKTVEGRV